MISLKLTCVRIDFSEHFRVLVGPEKKAFMVHKDVIMQRLPFFKAAVAKRWSGSDEEKVIELPEDDAEIFGEYLHCVYQDTVTTKISEAGLPPSLVYLYCLVDKLGDLKACNTVLDFLITASGDKEALPSLTFVTLAFEHTPSGSQLRRLLVDFWLHETPRATLDAEALESAPPAFLCQFMREYRKVKEEDQEVDVRGTFSHAPGQRGRCYYHVHDEGCPGCYET